MVLKTFLKKVLKFNFIWYLEEKLLIFNAHLEPYAYKQKQSYRVQ